MSSSISCSMTCAPLSRQRSLKLRPREMSCSCACQAPSGPRKCGLPHCLDTRRAASPFAPQPPLATKCPRRCSTFRQPCPTAAIPAHVVRHRIYRQVCLLPQVATGRPPTKIGFPSHGRKHELGACGSCCGRSTSLVDSRAPIEAWCSIREDNG